MYKTKREHRVDILMFLANVIYWLTSRNETVEDVGSITSSTNEALNSCDEVGIVRRYRAVLSVDC